MAVIELPVHYRNYYWDSGKLACKLYVPVWLPVEHQPRTTLDQREVTCPACVTWIVLQKLNGATVM